jgi:membrane protein implicated in regulation of membrane protease activity
MAESTLWWLLAGGIVAAELLTGTFYLLMLALGVAAAAIAAHLGMSLALQMVTAALMGASAVLACYFQKKTRASDPSSRSDRNVNMDVGETILIESWGTDGTATVKYRGAQWTAIHRAGITPSTGMHRIAELVGNRLLVDPV